MKPFVVFSLPLVSSDRDKLRLILIFFQARRAAADAAAGAAETIARVRLEAAANISESADRLVKVTCDVILCSILVFDLSVLHCLMVCFSSPRCKVRQHEQQQSQPSMWRRYVLMNQYDW